MTRHVHIGLATRVAAVTGLAAAALTTAAALTMPALAAGDTNSAFGVAASGSDPVSAQPSVSSSGAVQSDSAGSVTSHANTFTASDLKVQAGTGLARASVGNVVIHDGQSGKSIGAVSAECQNGRATASRSGTTQLDRNVTVTYGVGGGNHMSGAVIKIAGAAGRDAETITVADVTCGMGTPPVTTPPPTHRAPTPPGGNTGGGTHRTAPPATPQPGHAAVTG